MIQFIPNDALSKIEFDKVVQLLKTHCIAQITKETFLDTDFMTEKAQIDLALSEVSEMKSLFDEGVDIPLSYFENINEALADLSKQNYVLELEKLCEINHVIQIFFQVDDFMSSGMKTKIPLLYEKFKSCPTDGFLRSAITKVIDENNEVKPNASPELASIYKQIRSKESQIFKEFNGLLSGYKKQGLLTDSEESFRNGRRVLSIPSEHKRKIKGIIHDESATGKTTFIEPENVVYLNNELMDLDLEKRKEIYRILKELCNQLRPYKEIIIQYLKILIAFDRIRAKAKLAVDFNAHQPKIEEHSCLKIKQGFHPLLFYKNQKTDTPTIPFDLELKDNNRVFVISGPNAGGKSITLKTVGLLHAMTQYGLLIPADPDTKMGIISGLFCDIGDQQSVEDDLSTYSSRLKNMKAFLDHANESSLVLIDEFGSGTDPKMGGSIAQSILFELHKKKILGVITTHYSNLKVFAHKMKGMVNGAMHFDQEQLKPSYQLIVGKPGSSFAFEIAENVGLPKKILHFAKKNAGKNLRAMDSLISELQSEKTKIDEQKDDIAAKQKQLDRLVSNYQSLHRELEVQRKKFKITKKEQEAHDKAKDKKDIEKLIREIRQEQNLEKAKEILESVKTEQKQASETVVELKDQVYESTPKKKAVLEVGDFAKTRDGGMTGKILKIQKNDVILDVGNFTLTVKLKELVYTPDPLTIDGKKKINTVLTSTTSNFESKIDLRGYRRSEALLMVEEFLDQALISNASVVKIIHGMGGGVLKKAIRQKAKEYKDISSITSPEAEQGGEGVTIIRF